jgi:hypothetical protein
MVFLSPSAKDFASEATMVSWLEHNTRGKRRVWIAQYHGWWADRENRFVRACGTVMMLEKEWKFPRVPVYRFVRTGPGDARVEQEAGPG